MLRLQPQQSFFTPQRLRSAVQLQEPFSQAPNINPFMLLTLWELHTILLNLFRRKSKYSGLLNSFHKIRKCVALRKTLTDKHSALIPSVPFHSQGRPGSASTASRWPNAALRCLQLTEFDSADWAIMPRSQPSVGPGCRNCKRTGNY